MHEFVCCTTRIVVNIISEIESMLDKAIIAKWKVLWDSRIGHGIIITLIV